MFRLAPLVKYGEPILVDPTVVSAVTSLPVALDIFSGAAVTLDTELWRKILRK